MKSSSSTLSNSSLKPITSKKDVIQSKNPEQNSKTLNEPKKVQNLSKTSLENNKKPELTTSFYDSTEKIIKPIKRDKNSNDVMFLVKALKDHCLFAFLTENQLEEIVTNSNYAEIPQNTVILKEGDTFQKIYIIDKGTVELTHKNKSIRNSASGAILGDDLVYGNKSFYTAKSLQTCFLWVIDQKILKAIIEGIISKDFQDKISFLESIEFFQKMEVDRIEFLASILIPHKYSQNQYIIKKDEPAMAFFIIQQGAVQISQSGNEVKTLQKGEYFGEKEIYNDTSRQISVKTLSNVILYAVGRNALTLFFEGKLEKLVYRNLQKSAIKKCVLLSKFSNHVREKIIDDMKISHRKKADIIFQKDLPFDKIMIVLSGSMIKEKAKLVVCQEGQVIGEACVEAEIKTKLLNDNIIMERDGLVAEIGKEAAQQIIDQDFEESKKSETGTKKSTTIDYGGSAQEIRSLDDLIYFKYIGKGEFSSVHLVKFKNDLYSLKAISKKTIAEKGIEKHIQNEKAVLTVVSHPFIMKYYRSFEDNKFIYLLTEYIHGMELFDAIRNIGLLSTTDAKFYTGSLILFLEYMHTLGIVYRDLKPENIMVEESGFIKMIDFGNSKILESKDKTFTRTNTIIGTPHYMAPEMISSKGYTLNVDLWAVGVILYELMCGEVPFGENFDDPYKIYQDIIKKPVQYPNFLKDKKAKKLMEQLLNKVADARLGGSYGNLKANPWFEDFDFNQLFNKKMPAPYYPPKDILISVDELKKMNQANKKFDQSLIL